MDAKKLNNWQSKLIARTRQYSKQVVHTVTGDEPETMLFIFGCQRSGTTLVQRILEKDWHTKVYPEVGSALSTQDVALGLRLDPIDMVRKELFKQKAPFVIAKPLVESQNARQLLNEFPRAKGVWMYRRYADVVASKLKKSGMKSGIGDLRYIYNNTPHDWRSDKISEDVRQLIMSLFSEEMNPYDAAALYWYVRNKFYFEQSLASSPDMMLCKYEDLARDPLEMGKRIYAFVERPFPGDHLVSEVHAKSVGKGKEIEISTKVRRLCDDLYAQLEAQYGRQEA